VYDIEILDTCIRCGACVAVCPARVFVQNAAAEVAYPVRCILCGHCVAVCPVDAVEHHGFDGQEFPLIHAPEPVDPESLLALLRGRRSVREFRDRPVPRGIVEKLLDAGRYAPTTSNAQGVRYVVITDPARRAVLSRRVMFWFRLGGSLARLPGVSAVAGRSLGRARLRGYLSSLGAMKEVEDAGGDPVLFNAPVVIVTHARKNNIYGVENAAYATYHIALTAHTMGLGSCMIGYLTGVARYDPKVRRLAGIPMGHRMTTALIVGYPKYRYRRLVPRNPPRAKWLEADGVMPNATPDAKDPA
jgi:nitroreductase/NAD-dependent dihydropyrimidine dehydrogenase PreA subunit